MPLVNSVHSHICLQWCTTSPVSLHQQLGQLKGHVYSRAAENMWMVDFAFGNIIYQEKHKKADSAPQN